MLSPQTQQPWEVSVFLFLHFPLSYTEQTKRPSFSEQRPQKGVAVAAPMDLFTAKLRTWTRFFRSHSPFPALSKDREILLSVSSSWMVGRSPPHFPSQGPKLLYPWASWHGQWGQLFLGCRHCSGVRANMAAGPTHLAGVRRLPFKSPLEFLEWLESFAHSFLALCFHASGLCPQGLVLYFLGWNKEPSLQSRNWTFGEPGIQFPSPT